MTLYQLKPQFQALLKPIANTLATKGITANQVTLFTLILCITFAALLFITGQSKLWLALPLVLFIRMALNAIDGLMAREFNMSSKLGAVLNELGDLVADAAISFAFLAIAGFNNAWLILFVLLSWLTEFIAILAINLAGTRINLGPLGKSDRTLLLGILALIIGFGIDLSSLAPIILIAANLLLMFTIIRRTQKII